LAGRGPRPLARRLSKASASILPAALLMLMPKCPLCLAAWLTIATGVSFSATGAAWLRWGITLLWLGALAVMIWRLRVGRRPPLLARLR
jgi:hypothetical protein